MMRLDAPGRAGVGVVRRDQFAQDGGVNLARNRRFACAAAIALAALGASREGRTGAPDFATQLDYEATSECPTVEVFEALVERYLGHNPFQAAALKRVTVRIAASGRALEGHLEWRNASGESIGERTFPSRSGDCGELTRAMGFALALQIQLMAVGAQQAERAPPAPPAASTTAKDVSPPGTSTAPAPPPAAIQFENGVSDRSETRSSPSVLVGAGVSTGIGLTSDPVALGRLFVAAEWSHAAIELGGEVSFPSTTRRGDGAGFSEYDLLANVAGCGVHSPWSACAVAKMGELRVRGQGVNVPLTASGLMAQTGLRLAAGHAFGRRTYVGAHFEGLARLTGSTVTLDSMPVWRMPRFAAVLGIDIGLRFR